ncbi:ISPsy9, transposase OrfA [Pseudomonas syringae pv. atrofaciens]|uniref:ISPsy9, transposase OrfA n=1 Tax=Pseudomonas syringae pv. lapsa TaxID=199201 RepID=A0AB74A5U6_PSESX|nr:ISPsy9, transposase OrfA [Pseudomonas syringae pv. lapsa]RML17504.1 ISPsy9, transposase OrfA [Pseudomonas syringae pv. lapsa]RML25781.1 ISPsy9, transposase OrfA [Pseudomonas syringae pv. lapsa]RMM52349.1 ISPsy9, transposase OrfA [Pseudomonas syringae pv. atrofaciens]
MGDVMGKYTEQAKLAAVLDYRSGKAGLRNVADRHGVDFSTLRQWVMGYEIHGVAALKEKKPRRYSSEFKLTVLKRMNEERLSLRQTAALFDIRQFGIIGLWQRLHEEGTLTNSSKPPDKTGRPRKMPKPPPFVQSSSVDDESRSRDDLLAEVRQLRMEVDYLKKLDALVQEKQRVAQQKKRKS